MPIIGLDRMPGSGLARGTLFDKELNLTTIDVPTGTFSTSIILEHEDENKYTITWTQPSGADRILSIPALSAADTFTFNDATQTLTNKTITGGAATALTDLDMTSGDKTILDTIGSNTLTIGASGTTVVIAGNLTVSGTQTLVNTTTLQIADSLYALNTDETGTPSQDAGFVVERGTSANVGFLWDESADEFVVVNTAETGSTAGNVTISSYANLQAAQVTASSIALGGKLTAGSNEIEGSAFDINGGTVDAITSLTIANNVDVGNYKVTAKAFEASDLTAGRITFAGSNGLLADDSDFTFATDTLTVTKIGAFTAAGAINFDSQNMTNVDIDSGTIDGANIGSTVPLTNLSVDNLSFGGNTIQSTDTDGHMILIPNGAGNVSLSTDTVRIGGQHENATVTTYGTGDLILNTNEGSNSGSITIADGANADITLTPDGTGEVNIAAGNLNYAGTAILTTGAELNIIDGGTAATGTTLAAADRVVVNDNGTMVQVAMSDFETFMESNLDTLNSVTSASSLVTVGALNAGSITSGFTSIDVGAGAITTTGTVTGGAVTVDDISLNGKVLIMTGSASDTVTMTAATNGAFSLVTVDDAAAAANIQITADGTVDIDSAGILTLDSGAAINIEPAAGSAILLDGTISIDAGVITGVATITMSGELDAGSLDISGDADIDGTLEADAITVAGTALNEYIADTVGAMVGSNTETNITVTYEDGDNTLDFVIGTLNQDTTGTAAIATTVTITDNESTNENNAIIFTAGGDLDGGNLGLESDGTFHYNPSTGTVTATTFAGATSGNAATATEATNITAVANNSTNETTYLTFVDGATGTQGIETDTGLSYNPSTGVITATQFTGAVSGNASTATALASARTIGGTSFDGTGNIAVALAATATILASARTIGGTSFDGSANIVPATITVADTTDTTSFVALFESATGDLAPKTDAGITYNAGTGMLTATGFTGPLTGNASGTALTVTQAAQTAITSLGTLTALTGGTGDLVWDTDTLFVDSSEDRVGIGTAAPDNLLHIWASDTSQDATTGAYLILEAASNNFLEFMVDANTRSWGIIGKDGDDVDASNGVIWNVDASDTLSIRIASATSRLRYSAGAFAFQEATTISTSSGALTLDATTDVIVPSGTGLLVGHTANLTVGGQAAEFQVVGTGIADNIIANVHFSSDTDRPSKFWGLTSKHAVKGSHTAVLDGHHLVDFAGFGSNGSNFNNAAAIIRAEAAGTHSGSNAGGDWVFLTTTVDATAPTEKMRLTDAGALTFAQATTISTTAGALTLDPTTNVHIPNNKGLVIGHTAQLGFSDGMANGVTSEMQMVGTGTADGSVAIAAFSTGTSKSTAPLLILAKSASTDFAAAAIVADSTTLGAILFNGADGTNMIPTAASIEVVVDGTPAENRMPGAIIFGTTNDSVGAQTTTERMRINSAGNVVLVDSSKLSLGTGSDSQIYYDGTDTLWELQSTGTGALTIGLGGSPPTPDGNAVHIWESNSGTVTANADSMLVLESSGNTAISFLTGNDGIASLFFSNGSNNAIGQIRYDDNNTRFNFVVNGSTQLYWSNGAFAFQRDMTISTSSGALTLDPTTYIIIPTAKELVLGHTAPSAVRDVWDNTPTPQLQVVGTTSPSIAIIANNNVVGATPAASRSGSLVFVRSLNNTLGSTTLVTEDVGLGGISWVGADGSNYFSQAASITAFVDGTSGSADMPGRIVFSTTADGGDGATERLRIDSTGAIGIAGANYGTDGQVLTSGGAGAAVAWEDAGGGGADVQAFTSSGTWTKPAGAVYCLIIAIGAGGGGASGRRGSQPYGGGGGGGGGHQAERWIRASNLGATETVTLGAAGSAGGAQTSNDSDGTNGGTGGNTTFGSDVTAIGGLHGQAGTSNQGLAGEGGGYGYARVTGNSDSVRSAGGNSAPYHTGGVHSRADHGGGGGGMGSAYLGIDGGRSAHGGGGGGGGGGRSSSTEIAGGAGGAGEDQTASVTDASTGGGGGTAGATNGGAGAAGAAATNDGHGGSGGGGGGGNDDGAGGAGGAGGAYGGGGGGGAGCENGNNSGAGGAGGGGYCIVITI